MTCHARRELFVPKIATFPQFQVYLNVTQGINIDMAAKEATSPSSDVIRRRIPYQDLVTLHHGIVEQNMENLRKNKNS